MQARPGSPCKRPASCPHRPRCTRRPPHNRPRTTRRRGDGAARAASWSRVSCPRCRCPRASERRLPRAPPAARYATRTRPTPARSPIRRRSNALRSFCGSAAGFAVVTGAAGPTVRRLADLAQPRVAARSAPPKKMTHGPIDLAGTSILAVRPCHLHSSRRPARSGHHAPHPPDRARPGAPASREPRAHLDARRPSPAPHRE